MNRAEAPAFKEPWQAQALATALGLQEAGLVTPAEWSDALGAAIRRAQADGDPDTGDTYYQHVVAALESLLDQKGLLSVVELAERKAAWEAAYRATPHGEPVRLSVRVLDNVKDTQDSNSNCRNGSKPPP